MEEENKVVETEQEVIKPEGEGVSASTIARTVCLFLALANQLLAVFGKGSIELADEVMYQLVTAGFTVVSALVAWWKDNPFTAEARVTNRAMKDLKALKKGK